MDPLRFFSKLSRTRKGAACHGSISQLSKVLPPVEQRHTDLCTALHTVALALKLKDLVHFSTASSSSRRHPAAIWTVGGKAWVPHSSNTSSPAARTFFTFNLPTARSTEWRERRRHGPPNMAQCRRAAFGAACSLRLRQPIGDGTRNPIATSP